jgi:hypothetical protein
MIDPRVEAVCGEFGLRIIAPTRYPDIGETRAPKTILKIIRKRGEDHARWVIRTVMETNNNKVLADEAGLWAISDLVLAYWDDIQADPEAWFEVWDSVPVGRRQWEVQQRLSGIVNQRAALAGVVNQHLYERFDAPQPELPLEAGQ